MYRQSLVLIWLLSTGCLHGAAPFNDGSIDLVDRLIKQYSNDKKSCLNYLMERLIQQERLMRTMKECEVRCEYGLLCQHVGKTEHSIALLLAKKADPNVELSGNKEYVGSPLMIAVDCDNRSVVRVLLAHDADPTLVDRSGKTPVDIVRSTYVFDMLQRAMQAQSKKWCYKKLSCLNGMDLNSIDYNNLVCTIEKAKKRKNKYLYGQFIVQFPHLKKQ